MEERRFAAITAMRAVGEFLRETAPPSIFAAGKEGAIIDSTKYQSIANRWADKASDVLVETLDLAQMINADALSLFEGHDRYGAKLRDAERPAA
jgi:hypothetical protein